MRLLIVSSEFPPGPGGIGTHALQLALCLRDLGWEIEVVARQDYAAPEEVSTFNKQLPFAITSLQPTDSTAQDLIYRSRIVLDRVKHFQPELILATGKKMVWLIALLSPLLRRAWTAIGHGTEFRIGNSPDTRFTNWTFERARAVICVSQFTRDVMLRSGIRPQSEFVIPNGADDSRFSKLPDDEIREFRKKNGFTDVRLLVTVGNVTPRKGQDIVIRAMPAILKKHPNTVYAIVGLPTKREAYSALAAELGVSDNVRFYGRQPFDEVLRFMNAADVFAITSRYTADGDFEGYGIVVVEAAMCGTPSVVAKNSGLVEAIQDGITGIAVNHDDPEDTAKGILKLLDDDSLRQRMGESARQRALAEQTWHGRAAEYDTILKGLLHS